MEALNNLKPKLNAEFYGLPVDEPAAEEQAETPTTEEHNESKQEE